MPFGLHEAIATHLSICVEVQQTLTYAVMGDT
jgi:hypothetical protein